MEKKFCTYLTIYRGNKLPPFYIGKSTVKKVREGYNGSVRSRLYKDTFYQERKNHPHLFKTVILKTFDTVEESGTHETYIQTFFNVRDNPLFINRTNGWSNNELDLFNKERMENGTHQFLSREWQREMNRRAHASGKHPFKGGQLQSEINKKRVDAGTHNLLGRSDEVKSFIKDRANRENVKQLQQLKDALGIKLGQNWNRKPDEWIDAKIAELTV